LSKKLLTTDAHSLIVGADIVVELMGGLEPARTLILEALSSGADVITANKALLAEHGPELFDAANKVGAQLYYEAAVAAAIPIIRPLRDSLAGDQVTKIMGIVNGTTNYILDEMDTRGLGFEEALAAATELGYAEADPTSDIEGFDAAQKASILSSLAFHTAVPLGDVYREGISQVSAAQIESAKRSGHVIKLLAICERRIDKHTGKEGVSTRVHPTLIPRSHPLAAARGANNAVYVEAEAAGPLMFYGAGAGGPETASAVLGDIVSAARRHVVGGPGVGESTHADLPGIPLSHVESRLQIALLVKDEPGVLAAVAGVFSHHQVSVETLHQSVATTEEEGNLTATLVIQTHLASEESMQAAIAALRGNPVVLNVSSVLRVEG
jgi:homoserine dehydrogenase